MPDPGPVRGEKDPHTAAGAKGENLPIQRRGGTIGDAIVARGLAKRFGDLAAVDHIAFRVRKGEIFGFLGPNGAGKTTTMKMIQCISPKSGGALEVFGMDVDTESRRIKSRLGVVPPENNLDLDFSAYRNLLVYVRYFGIQRREAEKRQRNSFRSCSSKKNGTFW